MKKNVSTDTARELSERASGSGGRNTSSPSREFFLQNIRGRYGFLLSQKKKELSRAPDEKAAEKIRSSIDRYQSQLEKFEKAVANIPPQFSLTEIKYTRISKEQNQKVEHEYSDYVRPRFLMFLAEKFSDDLKKLGICDHGITRMKNGLDPADEHRNIYNMTVDHIIERAGSGDWGENRALDGDIPKNSGRRATYKVNHFDNLIMLPAPIHDDIKNAINEVQDLPSLKPGETAWAMMMVTRGRTDAECYMYMPADAQEQKRYVHKNKRNLMNEIYQVVVLAGHMTSESRLFNEFADLSHKHGGAAAQRKGALSKKFNGSEDAQFIFNRRIKPLAREFDALLDSIEARIAEEKKHNPGAAKDYEDRLSSALQRPVFGALQNQIRSVESVTGERVGQSVFQRRRKMLDDLGAGSPANQNDGQNNGRNHGLSGYAQRKKPRGNG